MFLGLNRQTDELLRKTLWTGIPIRSHRSRFAEAKTTSRGGDSRLFASDQPPPRESHDMALKSLLRRTDHQLDNGNE